MPLIAFQELSLDCLVPTTGRARVQRSQERGFVRDRSAGGQQTQTAVFELHR
jgi:hypothetical protein